MKMRLLCMIVFLSACASGQSTIPVLQNPVASQSIVQPSGTTLSVNRMENFRYAERFAGGSSTGGIQEAINDLPNGGTVILPAGTTTTTVPITVGNQVTIRGHGWSESVVSMNAATGDVFMIAKGGINLEDFAVTRTGTPTSGAGVHLTFPSGCLNPCPMELHITRLNISNQYTGISTDANTYYFYMTDSIISGSKADGADIRTLATHFFRNRFYFNGFPTGGSGIAVTNGGALDSEDDEVYANLGYGVYIDSTFSTGTPSAFRGTALDSNGSSGLITLNCSDLVFVDGFVESSGVTFNTAVNPPEPNYAVFTPNIDGVSISSSTTRVRINNNQITNNSRNGIGFYGAPTFEASNNQTFANGQGGGGSGISAFDAPGIPWKNGRIIGNRSWDQPGTSSPPQHQTYGVSLLGGSGGAVIMTDNDLLSNYTSSFYNTSTAREVVANNLCNAGSGC